MENIDIVIKRIIVIIFCISYLRMAREKEGEGEKKRNEGKKGNKKIEARSACFHRLFMIQRIKSG